MSNQPALSDLMPADTPAYMEGAWLGCIAWAIENPDIVAAFRAETGNQWTPARTPIDRMVDDATGAGDKFAVEFVQWVNKNIWGPIDGKQTDGD